MDTYENGRISTVMPKLVIGAFICLGIVLLVIAAVIVLSLISLYTPNHGEEGYGEQYQIKALFIKVLYQNNSFIFKNGTVAYSTVLTNLCSKVYENQGAKQFIGCLATNFNAFGPYDASPNSKRRRFVRATLAGIYEVGEVNLYYSSSCSKKNDQFQYANSTSLSNCAKSRLTACNNLVNSSLSPTPWTPLPTSFSQSIIDSTGASYQTIMVENILGIPFAIASSLAKNFSLSDTILENIQLGCQYIGPLPQADITNAFLSQTIETTTESMPTSSGSPLG